ncbi:uncharacterized protein LOC141719575 isoform X1 [Apium graveolens]|uniref:uncharacterized protein LOC141719575 isoform X1 n=1 Tax=Apium graveolens TaxID=4045 RepID=UPI003D7A45C4
MAAVEVPILSRLDRLDNILRQLDDVRGANRTPRSSCASTHSSGTLTSDGQVSSVDPFSPKSLEKHCRPIDDVIMETELKGTLIQRIVHVEDRLLQLCLQLEDEIIGHKREGEGEGQWSTPTTPDSKKKKNLKQLVKSCVKGKSKHKNK